MNKNSAITLAIIILVVAGLVYWILGGSSNATPTPAVATAQAASTPAQPAPKTAKAPAPVAVPTPAQPKATDAHRVATPTMPPVAQPVASTATTTQKVPIALTPQQRRSVTNNLRLLSAASQQYMLDKGVTQATYYDLVGAGTDNYIRSIEPVSDEDYTDIVVAQSTTQVEIDTPGGDSVTFDL